jgi:hypothetical protein
MHHTGVRESEFIVSGAMDVTKPYACDIHDPKPYEFIGSCATIISHTHEAVHSYDEMPLFCFNWRWLKPWLPSDARSEINN